ncbi:MAG: hypothetical protein R2695_12680 [Acidimicrobiales bacterium]
MLSVRPGTQLEYLAAVVEQRRPVLADHGVHATGLWQVVNNAHEVGEGVGHVGRVLGWRSRRLGRRARGSTTTPAPPDDRLVEWDRYSAEYVTGGRHARDDLCCPAPSTGRRTGEDAPLDQWIDPDSA